ncbi:MAG: malonyl-[acyl-carrier protein] O-methyltransferase [marine bacterium B5-7]|nr:MAG: malonyl-[acyl-carrier protein] O-methyltransferase [marine bacterium B5-7]
MDDTEYPLDRRRVRQAFDASADQYEEAAHLQRYVAEQLVDRLVDLAPQAKRIVDLGCGTGYLGRCVKTHYGDADMVSVDLAPSMTHHAAATTSGNFVCADIETPVFANSSFDLAVSNLTLQWCDFVKVFERIGEWLTPGGLWIFSTLGPDTLMELRNAYRSLDDTPRVHRFTDMHHLGDALLALGFKDPVLETERVTMTYPSVSLLMRDLKAIGAANADRQRERGLSSPRKHRQLVENYEQLRDADGQLPSTWEVVYGHAWQPGPSSVRVDFNSVIHSPK